MGSELTISKDQNGFTKAQLAALKQIGVNGATQGDLEVFFHYVQRTGLDPFTRQIYMIERRQKVNGEWVSKQTIQTGIDGLRLIARRAAEANHETFGEPETVWCGADHKWVDVWLDPKHPPMASKVTVQRGDGIFRGVATLAEYAGTRWDKESKKHVLNSMWSSKPAIMLSKCFDSETEVLTRDGFKKFAEVGGSPIMQVTRQGVEETDSIPFKQDYSGWMVAEHGDMLDYTVTPNHDMITTVGKVEAQALLSTARVRPAWRIPMTIGESSSPDYPVDDVSLKMVAAILADGSWNSSEFIVSVSRQSKIDVLDTLLPDNRWVKHSRGDVAHTETRDIKSNFDKMVFAFKADRVHGLIDEAKRVDNKIVSRLSQRQARLLLDTWIEFDGHKDRKSGVRRIYSSRLDHIASIELLSVMAGYSVSSRKWRTSDISERPNWYVTISQPDPIGVVKGSDRRTGIIREDENPSGEVWCVNVPSHVIVVRRRGFSMLCGNCAEALALRKAFPQDLSGLFTPDETSDAESEHDYVDATVVATQEQRDELANLLRGAGVRTIPQARMVFRALTGGRVDTADPAKVPDDDVLTMLENREVLKSRVASILNPSGQEASDGR